MVGDADSQAGLRRALAEVARRYAAAMPQKMAALRGAAARGKDQDVDVMRELLNQAHRLHGTAGTHGFAAVSDAAAALERLVADRLNDAAPGESDWAPIEGAVEDVCRAAADCGTPDEPAGGDAIAEAARPLLLLVDDDPGRSRRLLKIAKELLIELDVVEDVEDAIGRVRRAPYDGVLLDVDVGGHGVGFAAARTIRRVPGCHGLNIGFVAGDDSLENRIAATQAGGTLFLQRPVTRADLQDASARFAQRGRGDTRRVLIVDDDPSFAEHVQLILRPHGMEASHVEDPTNVLDALARDRPDLLLLDVMMPTVSGLDVCRTIRAMPEWSELLILFISAQPNLETRLACFEAGGDDYIQKPVLEMELLARIRDRLERHRLARERWERDALTGLLTRRAFVTSFGGALAAARRHKEPLAIALLDLDRFKAINDERGHLVGDRVLSALGRLLSRSFRPSDLACRWGGEEFLLAFTRSSLDAASPVVERALTELQSQEFEDEKGDAFGVSFSAGLACFPSDGDSLEKLLRVADRRLYRAKEDGRARVYATDPSN